MAKEQELNELEVKLNEKEKEIADNNRLIGCVTLVLIGFGCYKFGKAVEGAKIDRGLRKMFKENPEFMNSFYDTYGSIMKKRFK